MTAPSRTIRLLLVLIGLASVHPLASPVEAGTMATDPNGFNGIQWGASLKDRPEFTIVTSTARIKDYELTQGPAPFGEAKVDVMKFSTFDEQFARVTIRYKGQDVHAKVMAYLQAQYGPIIRTPGQTVRGLNQQYNWRGTDTEVNATYEGHGERGFVFIESTVLAPRFNDTLPEHAY